MRHYVLQRCLNTTASGTAGVLLLLFMRVLNNQAMNAAQPCWL
jgi:hypothetical protein